MFNTDVDFVKEIDGSRHTKTDHRDVANTMTVVAEVTSSAVVNGSACANESVSEKIPMQWI